MKKIFFTAGAVLLTILFSSCKKDKNDKQDADITPLFQNTIWTGEVKYTSMPFPEPFSITFDGYGSLIWEDRLGPSNGAYVIDKTDKSITLSLPKGKCKVIINNQKFSTITYDGAYAWKINSGEPNNESGKLLANTLWKGTETFFPNTQKPIQLNFLINEKINFNGGPDNYPYVKTGPNLELDFGTWGYYFILLPQNKLKGTFWENYTTPGTPNYRTYDLSKQ